MVKICFVLPSLQIKTSPIEGISLIIKYLSKNYVVYITGILDNEEFNNVEFGNAKVIVSKGNSINQKLSSLKKINANIYISSLFQSDILCSFLDSKIIKVSFIRSDLLLNYIYDKGRIQGTLMYFIHILALIRYSKIITLTEQNASRLIFTPKKKIKIIRNFFHENYKVKNTRVSENEMRLLYAGHLNKRKGIIPCLEIINSLIKKGYNLKLTILGDGPLKNKIKRYIAINDIISSVRVEGYVDNIIDYIQNTHYIILPSYSEGISRFVLESLFCGRKTIVRNVSGIDEVLNSDNSYLYTSNNDLKKLFIQLIDSKLYLNDPCRIYPKVFDKKTNLKLIEDEIISFIDN